MAKEVQIVSVRKILLCLIIITIASISIMISGCKVVTGSGEIITLEMDYKDFERIEVSSAFDVKVTRADSYMVTLNVDEALVEYLNVKKSGGTIYIGLKSGFTYMNQTRKAEITLPRLRRLELSGASDGIIKGFSSSDDIAFDISGASRLDLTELKTGDLDMDVSGASKVIGDVEMNKGDFNLSGASTIELTGSATDINIEASGASGIIMTNFNTINADVELSGASDAEIAVSERLSIDLSGASKLTYSGDPKLGSIDVSGSSSIVQK
jgi:copper(I)-binding protein